MWKNENIEVVTIKYSIDYVQKDRDYILYMYIASTE